MKTGATKRFSLASMELEEVAQCFPSAEIK
jgi:hypothetical protein